MFMPVPMSMAEVAQSYSYCLYIAHGHRCMSEETMPAIPTTIGNAMDKILSLKNKFAGMIPQMAAMMGGQMPSEEMMMGKLEQMREVGSWVG